MNRKANIIWIILTIAMIQLFGGAALGDSSPADINTYVRSLHHLEQLEESDFNVVQKTTDKEIDGYLCKSETYKGLPGFSTFMFTKNNADIMYPGALLNGRSVKDKSYTPSNIIPGPLTLTVNLQSIEGPISRTIQNPSFSTVQSAIHETLSQKITGDAGAEMSWSVDNIYSKEQLKAKMGMDFKVGDIAGGSASLGMDFTANTKKAIIQFNQKYYDIVVDVPRSPADYINSGANLDTVKEAFKDISPMYVSSVSYGRYILFSFETSDLSFNLEQELKAALTVPVEGVPVKAGMNTKIDAGFKNGSLKSKAYILGGAGGAASKAINSLDALITFIKEGGEYSKDSPGKPISYNLRYLSDNYPVQVINATEYIKNECFRIYNTYRVSAVSFDLKRIQASAFEQIDLYGWLIAEGSRGAQGGGTLWSKKYLSTYPIIVGNTQNINTSVDVNFGDLKSEKRSEAYIDIAMLINAKVLGIFEEFNPRTMRIYLRDLTEGEHTESIKTQWHELIITYKLTGVK